MPEKILITGAGGFIGANFCRYFLDRGARVIGTLGPGGSEWRLPPSHPRFALVPADLTSRARARELVGDLKPQVIINCAAFGAYPSQTEEDRIYSVNVDAVRFLLDAVKGVEGFRAFLQAGSSSEYGKNCTGPDEGTLTLPDSHYSVSKNAATALVRYYAGSQGVPAWSCRIYSIYGPYEEISRMIPQLLLKAAEGRLPPLVNPAISRDFLHVDDLARGFEMLIERAGSVPKGEIFNFGTGVRTTLADLVAHSKRLFGVTEEPAWGSMPNRKWDNVDWYANPAKAERLLGWRAAIPLEEGLRRTMDWMNANPRAVEAAHANSVVPALRKKAA